MEQEYRIEAENGRGGVDVQRAAERYMRAGLAVIPIPAGEKNPNRPGWQNERHALDDIPRLWNNGQNIGVLTGEPSGWLVDVDLDCPEALKIAGRFLDPTRTSGRGGAQDSHWWYRCEGIRSITFEDQDGETILEIRSSGRQTVIAPSLHPSGDRYLWSDNGVEVCPAAAGDLLRRCRELATAALVARVLPSGGRHRFGLALAGFLLRRGLEPASVEKITHAAWDASEAGFESERAKRAAHADIEAIVEDTAEALAEGSEVIGGVTLDELRPGLPRKIGRYWRWKANVREPGARRPDSEAGGYSRTDIGNAERIIARHGDGLRYVYDWKKWLVQDGKRWKPDNTGEVVRRAKRTVKAMYHEADPGDGSPVNSELAKHAIKSESKSSIEAMIVLAQSEVPVIPDELDRDPWLLNVENGTIDLRGGELREHRREDLITKIAPVEYDPAAEAPIFEEFLKRILPSESLRKFVQRAVGYAATGVVTEEVLVILHGTGDNGKTTLINAIMEALGDYAIQAARDLLLTKQGAHPTELTDLFGTRFVGCSETDDGRRLAEALVKQLTGRAKIRARGMREDFWEFAPTHTIFLDTNHRPEVRGTDHAIWRRIKLVPFEVKIDEAEKDRNLPAKLREELPGILAWIVQGCLEYQRQGLGEPDEVTNATAGYRAEMDVLAAFIEDECEVRPEVWAKFANLYAAYTRWCDESNEKPEKKRRFADLLTERGFEKGKGTDNVAIRWGIALRHGGGPDPARINDDPPDSGSAPPKTAPRSAEGDNSVVEELSIDNPQNTCKSRESNY